MEWEEILHTKDFIGGGIEIQENGIIYRGPLRTIHKMQDYIILVLNWTIMSREANGLWHECPITHFVVNADSRPSKNIKGELHFTQEAINRSGIIFPLRDDKINEWRVHATDLFKQ